MNSRSLESRVAALETRWRPPRIVVSAWMDDDHRWVLIPAELPFGPKSWKRGKDESPRELERRMRLDLGLQSLDGLVIFGAWLDLPTYVQNAGRYIGDGR